MLNRRGFVGAVGAASLGLGLGAKSAGSLAEETGLSMITRAIASSGEAIPVIGMGTSRTFDAPEDPDSLTLLGQVMKAFFANGGSVIDSSPMYGNAESRVGDVMRLLDPAPPMFAATKVWTTGKDQGIAQMEESAKRMSVETFDLIAVHNLQDWQTHMATLKDWKEQGKVVYAIGGASSNHIVACLQVMIEHKIDYRLILLKSAAALSLQGNPAYISLLSDPSRILWLEREQWPDVEKFAEDEARSRDEDFLIMKEGGAQWEAFPGAMTLGQDILRNQAEHGFSFHNIFIDAGTGYSALALKYYLDSVGFPGMLHVVKLAPFDFEKMEKAISLLN